MATKSSRKAEICLKSADNPRRVQKICGDVAAQLQEMKEKSQKESEKKAGHFQVVPGSVPSRRERLRQENRKTGKQENRKTGKQENRGTGNRRTRDRYPGPP
ncbi:hypothetical protein GJV26_04800 [Massilia dura]|uniref:Uncharacterized protein n=1 Tax=Pseudoduganella dura TaxID=321982 RepID=A0A6I3XJC5_9BURK|nr:hypothetical protein [Pseudoduganella dura]MUI11805.1 hypothetical protein [Pseudoduganella dura]